MDKFCRHFDPKKRNTNSIASMVMEIGFVFAGGEGGHFNSKGTRVTIARYL